MSDPVIRGRASAEESAAQPRAPGAFGMFAQLTRSLRHAETLESLQFSIVNETRRLMAYRQAALLLDGGDGTLRTAALSGVPVVERHVPLVRWFERVAGLARHAGMDGDGPSVFEPSADSPCAAVFEEGRANFGVANVLWCPLVARDGKCLGVLWLDRLEPWREAEILLIGELVDAQAHALHAITGGKGPRRRPWRRTGVRVGLAVLAVGVLAIPVPRVALAPAEITARDPEVVAAPIDGVVREFQVRPNQKVAPGDPLFTLDDTDRQAKVDVAEKALDIARAEYRQASQGALGGRRDAPRLAELQAGVALKEIELDNARRELERTRAKAGRAGVAILPDPQDWIGRPVVTGERVMLVADPADVRARAWLPVRDTMPMSAGMPVRLFLDVDPLTPIDGRVVDANHEAEEVPGGTLAYRVTVALTPLPDHAVPRIGLKGTARIQGERVPLFLYLFRRPIASLRQHIGL